MSDAIFLVYEHWRLDTDLCFYVGKGTAKRANILYGRNRYHTAIQNKLARMGLAVEVRVVEGGLTEEEAFILEIERIAFWRAQGVPLANLTAGGEGTSDPSEETRALMRAAKLGGKLTDEHKAKIAARSREALARPEVKAKLSAAIRLSHQRPEVKAKLSHHQKTRVRSREQYEKTSAALMGRKLSPEHIEKMRIAATGRKQCAEEIEKRRAANKGRKRTPEFCARMASAWTPERKARQAAMTAARSAAMNAARIEKGAIYPSDETKAKLKAAWVRRRAKTDEGLQAELFYDAYFGIKDK